MDRNNRLSSLLGGFLQTFSDLMILNVLWFICCLPLVTFGPATSALCCVALKLAGDEPVYLLKDFFSAFRRNFGQGLVLGLIGVLGAAVAVVDTLFALAQVGWLRVLYLGIALFLCAAALSYFSYVFALHARFDNSGACHVKNALRLAFVAPGQTLKIWLAFSVPVLCALYLPWDAVVRVGFVFLLLGVSAPAYFTARVQRRLFARFAS